MAETPFPKLYFVKFDSHFTSMNRFVLSSLLALCSLGMLQAQKVNYNIRFHINGLKDSSVYLANYYGDKQYIQDTLKADSKGNVVLKNKQEWPGGIYLLVLPGKKYFEFIFTEKEFTLETDTADFVKNMKVKGSMENTVFYDYLQFISARQKEAEPLRRSFERLKDDASKKDSLAIVKEKLAAVDKAVKDYKVDVIEKKSNSFLSKIFKASQDPEVPEPPKLANGKTDSTFSFKYYKAHFLDHVDFSDERLLRTPVLHNKIETYIKKLTVQIPDSITAAADYLIEKARANKEVFKYVVHYITNTYETSPIMGMDAVFVYMAEKYYTKDQAYWVDDTQLYKIQTRAKTLKPLLLDKKAPAITMKDSAGVAHALYDVKAKFTILLFWDPDCGHCQKSMPKFIELYKKYKSKGVEIYAVCTEVEMDKWRKYIREHKLDWINVADPKFETNFRALYDITSTPQVYFLNDKKEIKAKKVDAEQLDDIIEHFMKEKEKEKGKE